VDGEEVVGNSPRYIRWECHQSASLGSEGINKRNVKKWQGQKGSPLEIRAHNFGELPAR